MYNNIKPLSIAFIVFQQTLSSNLATGYFVYGGGIYCTNNSCPSLLNSIVSDNTGYYGIYVYSGNPSITYSDFYNNENGNFYNCGVGVGVNVTTNANGDSCDAYYNIQEDPLFVDPANGDYHLSWTNYPVQDSTMSPCIDAGDPNSTPDPDDTIADMGAYYFDQSVVPDYSVTLSPYNPPIEIPAGGGTFDYNILITNNTNITQTFYAVIFVTLPNGSNYGPISPTPVQIQLPAGGTIDVDLTQNVPGNAPAGVYTYYCLVGTDYNTILDSSGFTFTKLGTFQAAGTGDWISYYSDVGIEMRDNDLWTVDGIYREDGTLVYGSMSVDENLIPDKFTLYQNYPNPFNPVTTIRYDLSEQSYVTVVIYDMLGRTVRQLVNTTQGAGYRSVQWDATDSFGKPVSAGIYLYQIKALQKDGGQALPKNSGQAGEFIQTRKMVLLK